MSKAKNQPIVDTLVDNYMPYAMSVIVSRALPEIDGLKPAHRKILYTMYKMHLLKGARTKSANVVGQTMKLHPHGDLTIYDTLVRLSKGHEALLLPYIDSKGNFGKVTSRDMAYAAPRYTEVKLSEVCEELFQDIEQGTVDFVDNYDGSLKEPVLLPVKFPTILVNSGKGIAVGMASSFPGFNLEEVCNFTSARLKDASAKPEDYLEGPDFPTGAYMIRDENALRSIYERGVGSVKLRAKYKYDSEARCIEITEIPYSTTVEAIIDKIISVYKTGKLKEINEVRDETDLSGLKIAIDVKRGADIELLMAKLYKMTPLEDSYACNMNLLIDGSPMVLGVGGVVDKWIENRMAQIVGRLNYEKNKLSERLHLLKGLEKVLLDIDKAIKIIRETEEDKKVIPNLMAAFSIDEDQANYVAEIKLRNLNKDYLLKSVSEIVSLKERLEEIDLTLADDAKVRAIIDKEVLACRDKYKAPRRTEILGDIKEVEITKETLIEDYNVKLFLSKEGYLKKVPLKSLKAVSEHKHKEDDELLMELNATNSNDVMIFTDKQNVHFLKAHELPDAKLSELGSYIYNILEMEAGERPVFMHATSDYRGHFIFAFEDGKMAKVPLASYTTKTNRKKLINAYGSRAKLFKAFFIEADVDLIAVRSDAKSKNLLLFNTELIPEKTTRSTQGVQVVRLKRASWISSVELLENLKLRDAEIYRLPNIPQAGTALSPEDFFENPGL